MPPLLDGLRRGPQPTPAAFVGWNPGCWIQYYDDTGAKDPRKALSARSLDPDVARRKQREGCAVCYSLQAFGAARVREELLCFRNLGVDVDLVTGPGRRVIPAAEVDRRKEEYLARLRLFPLRPHWLVESRHGFHVVFRVRPLREQAAVRAALAVNQRLVAALGGDPNAALLTQVLRVPGTWQFKEPRFPFLCRLLIDNAGATPPYALDDVRQALDAWEASGRGCPPGTAGQRLAPEAGRGGAPVPWRDGLAGVAEGHRNATAAAILGRIIRPLPVDLWETAGWGGLQEWNRRNPVPLPERELRGVFLSIARRERRGRESGQPGRGREDGANTPDQVEIPAEGGDTPRPHESGAPSAPRVSGPVPPPPC